MDRNIENKFATVSGTCPLNQTSTQIHASHSKMWKQLTETKKI